MKIFSKILFAVLSVLYPLVVFACLVIFRVPVKIFSLFVVFIALVYMLLATGGSSPLTESGGGNESRQSRHFPDRLKKNLRLVVSSSILFTAGLICFLTGQVIFIKLYPLFMNLIFLFTFASTLFSPPNICFRFACIGDKKIHGSMNERRIEKYCYKVTLIWCGFFILNGAAAVYTVFCKNDKIWSVYNGGISYLLMGLLFAVEFIVRKVVNFKMPKIVKFSNFNSKSYQNDRIICFDRRWSDKKYFTWQDFLKNSAKMRRFIKAHDSCQKWILNCEDSFAFLCSFVALFQCKKTPLISVNISPNYIEEIRSEDSTIRFLTDKKEVEGIKIENADYIPMILKSDEGEPALTESEINETPLIDPKDSKIVMFTSGSTGHPKEVVHTLAEFEADMEYIAGRWFDEFNSRKFVYTVSHHHIYGLLYMILLPFFVGVPFRRQRIEFPGEFEDLDDESYSIITVPAFLKRTNAEREGKKLNLKNPWIFTSGGAVSVELAKETEEIFGVCPWEGYGSTETGGIAYRKQSESGLIWEPIKTAKIWADKDDGCLTIISPYITDPAGFKTGDMVEIYDDGRFLLKGRIDSIVKIEEKRISVTEVENRLLQTGLVLDCAVVPMSDRRQYLAAAIVLNSEGKKKFSATEKYLINRHFHDYLLQYFENVVIPKKWRFLDKIPCDIQGKKHKAEIQALFSAEKASDGE